MIPPCGHHRWGKRSNRGRRSSTRKHRWYDGRWLLHRPGQALKAIYRAESKRQRRAGKAEIIAQLLSDSVDEDVAYAVTRESIYMRQMERHRTKCQDQSFDPWYGYDEPFEEDWGDWCYRCASSVCHCSLAFFEDVFWRDPEPIDASWKELWVNGVVDPPVDYTLDRDSWYEYYDDYDDYDAYDDMQGYWEQNLSVVATGLDLHSERLKERYKVERRFGLNAKYAGR